MNDILVVGDTIDFATVVPQYPANAGWTLTYRLMPRTVGITPVTWNAAPYNTVDYRSQVGASTTATWTAGDYSWEAYVTLGNERHTIDEGQVTLKANPATATSLDNRSHAKKVLDAIYAVIENRASQTQREMVSYTIGMRSQTFDQADTKSKLLEFKSKYEWLVANEQAREAVASGQPNPRLIGVRFNQP